MDKLRFNETPAIFDSCGLVLGCFFLGVMLVFVLGVEIIVIWKQLM